MISQNSISDYSTEPAILRIDNHEIAVLNYELNMDRTIADLEFRLPRIKEENLLKLGLSQSKFLIFPTLRIRYRCIDDFLKTDEIGFWESPTIKVRYALLRAPWIVRL